tara:strand:+ start:113 stop:805 length:693 start_codon:yes stop_codon:yes gene_type:complete
MEKAMTDNMKRTIKQAQGSHAVFLAVRHDAKLAGKYASSAAGTLYMGDRKLGKADMAQLLVYLTGQYGLTPTEFELYSGVLAAVPQQEAPELVNARQVEPEVLDMLRQRLRKRHVGVAGAVILQEFNIEEELGHDWIGRAGEMKLSNAMESIGWKRRRSMVNGLRRYRWYPPNAWDFARDAEVELLPPPEEDFINVDDDPRADEENYIFEDEQPIPAHMDDTSHLSVIEE